MTISDNTGYLNLMASGQEAEKLSISVGQLQQAYQQNADQTTNIQAAVQGKLLLYFLKNYTPHIKVPRNTNHSVVTAYAIEEVPNVQNPLNYFINEVEEARLSNN
ncbi:hypothetical protein ACH5RR_008305 [Cinchona calisaya]|uniref:Uncharacterized protein n=1 Tax=Cinchona calisaya TaxID=153742 RepID=A0ABD3ACW6_9GENT